MQTRHGYRNVDILNRSYGIHADADTKRLLESRYHWRGEGLRLLLPQFWRAHMQTSTPPSERTIVVYAHGNESSEQGGLGADIPFYEPHVRGTQVSVMALAPDGSHADYTNFCGTLPPDWDPDRWGRHFCLAAPGTLNAVGHEGRGADPRMEIEGTSFAAPMVSGGLALLMEQFRGQLGNDRIVRRLIDTADHSGQYESLEIYGAGVMDLEAALAPMGRASTGTSALSAFADSTRIVVPAAYGDLGARFAALDVEIAGLDEWGAPFWQEPHGFFASLGVDPGVLPRFESDDSPGSTPEPADFHLGFTPGTYAARLGRGFAVLAGENRIGFESVRRAGWRWGSLVDQGSWLGGRSSGAFGDGLGAFTAWIGRNEEFELSQHWRVGAGVTAAFAAASLQDGAMLAVDPTVLSTWNLGLEHGDLASRSRLRIAISQPVRAETGHASLTYLTGLSDGEAVYRRTRVPLAPEGRMLDLSLRYERKLEAGRLAFQIAHGFDSGHRKGASEFRVGFGYRLVF